MARKAPKRGNKSMKGAKGSMETTYTPFMGKGRGKKRGKVRA